MDCNADGSKEKTGIGLDTSSEHVDDESNMKETVCKGMSSGEICSNDEREKIKIIKN